MRRRVLVIEDNPSDRELVAANLEPTKYEIQTADTGALGVHLATEQPPDLILLDIYLPDFDGYEVCRQLRQIPQTRHVPIIVITASDDPALHRNVYAAGVQACIHKPYRSEALLVTIEAVLASGRSGGAASR